MTIVRSHYRFSLVQKLIAGFTITVLCSLTALLFSLNGLLSLKKTALDIAHSDLTALITLDKLRESMLAQERYARKYRILPSHEFIILSRTREKEFSDLLLQLQTIRSPHEVAFISKYYAAYQNGANQLFAGKPVPAVNVLAGKVMTALDDKRLEEQLKLTARLADTERSENQTISWVLIFSFSGFTISIIVASLFIFRFSKAIRHLQQATHRIAEGDFDFVPDIPPGDEIGILAQDFVRMATRLKELEQIQLDASPLTRLPGNIAIERALTRHLDSGETFAVCYADLDNFKAYNDRYGYIQASELLKWTAEIIHQAAKSRADADTFVGHVGGDDFVLVVRPEQVEAVCSTIIERFDESISTFYSAEDVAAGGIVGPDRYGVERSFPIMTISIAVAICQRGNYDTALEVAQVAAQIKDHVKVMPGSNYLVNRRKLLR
jgi:diguanylate cyclase (GGDEF)-like protein